MKIDNIEEWKDVKGYEGLYQISNLGRIKSLERYVKFYRGLRRIEEKILRSIRLQSGYMTITLCNKEKNKNEKILIHRLVAITFLENSNNYEQVNHINGIKFDNRVENLEWVTCKDNQNHAYQIGLKSRTMCNATKIKISIGNKGKRVSEESKEKIRISHQGEKGSKAKLTTNDVLWIYENRYKYSQRKIARMLNISFTAVRLILIGKNWKHIYNKFGGYYGLF